MNAKAHQLLKDCKRLLREINQRLAEIEQMPVEQVREHILALPPEEQVEVIRILKLAKLLNRQPNYIT